MEKFLNFPQKIFKKMNEDIGSMQFHKNPNNLFGGTH